jgi:hypothetical protein
MLFKKNTSSTILPNTLKLVIGEVPVFTSADEWDLSAQKTALHLMNKKIEQRIAHNFDTLRLQQPIETIYYNQGRLASLIEIRQEIQALITKK